MIGFSSSGRRTETKAPGNALNVGSASLVLVFVSVYVGIKY